MWWPPLFPVIESFFYFIFGVSLVSAKLAVIFLGILGIYFFFKLINLIFIKNKNSLEIAFFSSVLFSSIPLIYQNSRSLMREFPAMCMMIISFYFFYKYVVRTESKPKLLGFKKHIDIYLAALFWLFAMYIKSELLFMAPIFILFLIFTKRYRLIISKHIIFAVLLTILLVLPWIVFALEFQPERIETSLGGSTLGAERFSLDNWFFYIKDLPAQLGYLLFAVSLIAFIYLLATKHKQTAFLWGWLLIVYLFFSYVAQKHIRYTLYYMPVFAVFAVLLFFNKNFYKFKIKKMRLTYILLIILCAFSIIFACSNSDEPVNSYYDAAKYISENQRGESVFFLGNNNGDFVYNMRTLDKNRDLFVLRGSIFLTSFNIYTIWGTQEYVNSEKSILKLLNEMGVYYVVIEQPVPFVDPKTNKSFAVFTLFEEMLKTKQFTKLNTYKIKDRNLNLYKYNNHTMLSKDNITIPLFAIDRNITVKLN